MLHIRQAVTDDVELIHEMANIVFPATYKEILTQDQLNYMMEWMYSLDNIRKQMEQDGHIYFIATYNNNLCGYISIEQQDTNLFHLQKIYVLPQFQGLHIGRSLFEYATRFIKDMHPSPCLMELNVNRNNKAIRFYQKLGMKILREGDFHIGNGYYMNDYIMGIEL